MIYLALDQSSSCTGYAVFIDTKLEKWGKINLDGEFFSRVNEVKNFMLNAIKTIEESDKSDGHKIKVVLEDIQLQTFGEKAIQVDTFKKLAMLLGTLCAALEENNIDYEIIYATSWKAWNKIQGRKRQEQKRYTQQLIEATYGIKVTQDEADAICLGRYAANKEMNWS